MKAHIKTQKSHSFATLLVKQDTLIVLTSSGNPNMQGCRDACDRTVVGMRVHERLHQIPRFIRGALLQQLDQLVVSLSTQHADYLCEGSFNFVTRLIHSTHVSGTTIARTHRFYLLFSGCFEQQGQQNKQRQAMDVTSRVQSTRRLNQAGSSIKGYQPLQSVRKNISRRNAPTYPTHLSQQGSNIRSYHEPPDCKSKLQHWLSDHNLRPIALKTHSNVYQAS